MIAHRLKTVERADNLIVIEQGELKGVGTHENLMGSCPLYAEMVAANERKDRWTINQCEEGGSKK